MKWMLLSFNLMAIIIVTGMEKPATRKRNRSGSHSLLWIHAVRRKAAHLEVQQQEEREARNLPKITSTLFDKFQLEENYFTPEEWAAWKNLPQEKINS
jgi:hypothetical protein